MLSYFSADDKAKNHRTVQFQNKTEDYTTDNVKRNGRCQYVVTYHQQWLGCKKSHKRYVTGNDWKNM